MKTMAIDISKLTEQDVGSYVIYTDGSGRKEDGYITSFNKEFIFVRYSKTGSGQATDPRSLEFAHGPE